jgi:uncharacterized protein
MKSNFDKLVEWFIQTSDKAIVALSGGVDSAVVALAAKKAFGDRAVAITADYRTLSEEELTTAKQVAKEIGITHNIITYDELQNSKFVENDKLRCYYCRTELGQHLAEEARKAKISLVVDGTNIDDLADYRPGIRALKEYGIRSPMVEIGINKEEVRNIAKQFGLSIYDKPSNACLASRIPAGIKVTYEKLKRIENAEIIIKTIFGVRQVRVRDHGDIARIEVFKEDLNKMFDVDKLALMDRKIKEFGFKFVSIDAAGYKTGKLVVVDNDA